MTLSERNKVISSGPLVREESSPQKHEAHGEKLVSGAPLTLQCLLCDRLWEEDEQISCRVQANTCIPHSKWPASGIREEFSKLHSTKKKKIQLERGPKIRRDTSGKKIYRGQMSACKDAQHHQPVGRCKLKSHEAIPIHLSEWPKEKWSMLLRMQNNNQLLPCCGDAKSDPGSGGQWDGFL